MLNNQRVNNWVNTLILFSALITMATGIYWAYSSNVYGIKQTAINKNRVPLFSKSMVSRQQIVNEVTSNKFANKDWHRHGTIVIPSLQIALPIYDQPYNQDALKIGAQQINPENGQHQAVDTAMGNGNLILVAHNYNDSKTMFSALQQNINQNKPYLVNGSLGNNNWLNGRHVYTANDSGIYDYVIDSQNAIYKTDLSVVGDHHKNELNIITCLYPADNNRIATHAYLNRHWNWQEAPRKLVSYFDNKANPYNLDR